MYGIPNMKLEKKYVMRRVELMREEGCVFCHRRGCGPGQECPGAAGRV